MFLLWWSLACAPTAPEKIAIHPLRALPSGLLLPKALEIPGDAWPFPKWDTPGIAVYDLGDAVEARWPSGEWARGAWGETGPLGHWSGGWSLTDTTKRAFSADYSPNDDTISVELWGLDQARVAQGQYSDGAPQGPWEGWADGAHVRAHLVYGQRHGGYHREDSSGVAIDGHYFDDTRNYEWEFYQPSPAGRELTQIQAWKLGTFVAEWDPRVQKNPLPDRQLPATLGPNGEGLMTVHATCATNAIMTLALTGNALSEAKLIQTPALIDVERGDPRSLLRAPVILVEEYLIREVRVEGEEAAISVDLGDVCARETEGWRPSQVAWHLDLRWRHEVWTLARPLPAQVVRPDVYVAAHPEEKEQIESCFQSLRNSRP